MNNLIFKDGIWHTCKDNNIDYPKEGNSMCYQVEDSSYWFKNRNALVIETLGKYIKKESLSEFNILDVGGGNGFVSKGLQESGYNVTLLEPGEGAINAKERGISHIYKCTLEELPKNLQYNAIGFFDVLEHLQNPAQILRQALSKLKPNGLIIATVPAYQFLYSEDDAYAGHYVRYNLKTLKTVFNEANLQVIYYTYFFSPLLLPIFLFRAIPSKLGLSSQRTSKDVLKSAQKEHQPPTIITKIINCIFSLERFYIKAITRLPLGASLLVVAKSI